MSATLGDKLGGRYELTKRIAAGGMGEVWRAKDDILGRTVAIKVLKEGLSDDVGFEERFRNEARLSASLSHHNICQVYDYGEDDGQAYLVMEFIDGQTLAHILDRHAPLTPEDTCSVIEQAAAALEAAHKGKLIHRDIKPGNILIDEEGTAKLTDFGISRAAGAAAMTRTGEVMGTAQYLAPEQAMGRPATPQSDIYALGIVAYECLTGERPFDRDTPIATALAQVNDQLPPLPPTVPGPLRDLVHACLNKQPEGRPGSAAEIAKAMRAPQMKQVQHDNMVSGRPAASEDSVLTGQAPPYGPHTGPNSGPHSGPHSGPMSGPQSGPMTTGPNSGPHSGPMTTGPNSGPHSGPMTTGPNSGPQSGPMSGPISGPQSGPTPTGPQQSGPSGSKPKWLWPVVGGAVALIALIVILIVALGGGGGDKSPDTPTPPDGPTQFDTPWPEFDAAPLGWEGIEQELT